MYKMIESYYEHADRGEVTDRLTDTEKAVKMRESSRRTEDQEVISLVVTTLEQQGNICL